MKGKPASYPDAANDQVISDQQGIFHGAGRNDARLADRSVDQQKNETNPEPGENLATNATLTGKAG